MLNVKVNQFKGLYTNIPSDISSLEVFDFIEGKILKDKIIAEKLIAEKIEDLGNIVYIGSFILDSDRYERVWNKDKFEYENNYSNEFKNVLLIVTKEENKHYISLYSDGEYLKIKTSVNDREGSNKVLLNGKFNKAISYDGAINIFTDKGIYVIRKLKKILKISSFDNPYTYYDGIYIYPLFPELMYNYDVNLGNENSEITKRENVKLKFIKKQFKVISYDFIEYYIGGVRYSDIYEKKVELTIEADVYKEKDYLGTITLIEVCEFKLLESGNINEYHINKIRNSLVKVFNKDGKIIVRDLEFSNNSWNDVEYFINARQIAGKVKLMTNIIQSIGDNFNENVEVTIEYNDKVKEAFDDKYPYLNIYLTAKFLDGRERVLANKVLEKSTQTTKYSLILEFNFIILRLIGLTPPVISLQDIYDLEAFRVYLGNKDTKGELIAEYNLYSSSFIISNNDIIDKTKLKGIHIEQTCGSAINYEYEDIFDDAVVVRGALFVKKGHRIFYPVIGNGNVTTVYLKDNYISNIKANYLADINGSLGVFSDDKLLVLHFDSEDNVLLFTLKDEMGFSIRDYRDLAYSPDGILILTKGGLYATNVQNIQLLSEAINNIIQENIDNLNLVYNTFTNEVLLIAPQMIYVYDFIQQIWKNNSIGKEIKDIVYDNTGNLYYYTDNEFGKLIYKPSKCKIISKNITLNELNVYKRINYFKINGKGNIKLKLNNKEYVKNLNFDNIIFVMLKDRIPQKVFKYEIELEENAEIYGYTINLELIKDRHEYIIQT